MKVLGIVCSPRRGGNTEILVEEALATAREVGAETEIFLVADKDIKGCDGCLTCSRAGVCRIKDDMQPLYQQMEDADAIIFGTPVYYANVSAQAKAIMDRTFLFGRGHRLQGKVAASIVAVRRVGAGQTRSILFSYFMAHGMIPTWGGIGYGREKGDVRTGDGGGMGATALEEAQRTGASVVKMVKRLARS